MANSLFILTAQDCPHCVSLRKGGSLSTPDVEGEEINPQNRFYAYTTDGQVSNGRKGWGWNKNFFLALLSSGTRVYEVFLEHYHTTGDPKVIEFSQFGIEDIHPGRVIEEQDVYRTTYYPDDSFTSIVGYYERRPNHRSLHEGKSFSSILRSHIPKQLFQFVDGFPCFIFVSKKELTKALRDESYDMCAYNLRHPTQKNLDGKWTLNRQIQRKGDPVEMAHKPETFVNPPAHLPEIIFELIPIYK